MTNDTEPLALLYAADLLLRSRVEEGLRAEGYRVAAAAGPARLRERLDGERATVALVDLDAPGALDAVAAIAGRGVTAIGFCGHTDVEVRQRALEAGCARVATRGQMADRLDRVLAAALPTAG